MVLCTASSALAKALARIAWSPLTGRFASSRSKQTAWARVQSDDSIACAFAPSGAARALLQFGVRHRALQVDQGDPSSFAVSQSGRSWAASRSNLRGRRRTCRPDRREDCSPGCLCTEPARRNPTATHTTPGAARSTRWRKRGMQGFPRPRARRAPACRRSTEMRRWTACDLRRNQRRGPCPCLARWSTYRDRGPPDGCGPGIGLPTR